MKKRILVVEDEDKLRRIVELQLLDAGFEVDKAAKAEEALPLIDRADLVLTDYKLPGMTGLEMLQIIRRQNTLVPVIIMTAFGTVENAVEAMKAGAADFLPKPFSLDHLTTVVNKALEVRNLRDENVRLKEELGKKYNWDNIVGRSPAMQQIFSSVMRVSASRATVLLAGESGVGKDLIDRARNSLSFAAPRQAFRQDQLHRAAGKPDGKRAVWLRKRRVHRRQYVEGRQIRAGRYRHSYARRNRRRAG
jgi:DNA-binding NtrC family response regulator